MCTQIARDICKRFLQAHECMREPWRARAGQTDALKSALCGDSDWVAGLSKSAVASPHWLLVSASQWLKAERELRSTS